MAPVTLVRLPAALVDLLAPREPNHQPRDVTTAPIAVIARRLHSLSRTSTLATRTPPDASSRALDARQNTITSTIPGAYPGVNAGPDPGTVVGITLGSVAGFLLLLWLLYTCLSMGNRGNNVTETVSSYGTESVVTRKSRRHHPRHQEYRSTPRRETVEVRTSHVFPGGAAEPPPERVVMEETIRRSSTPQAPQGPPPPPPQMMAPGPPPGPPPPRPPPRMVPVDDDDDEDEEEEEVVVIEEHTPPRKHRSQRHSHKRRSSSARRESGYRDIEPDRFAGGNAPLRDIRRSSRHGR